MPKPAAVSVKSLAVSINNAVRIAAKRHAITLGDDTILDKWEIVGRVVTNVKDLNTAFDFAKEVSAAVKIPGLKPDPIVVKLGKKTLVGFIDRGGIPRQLPR